MGKKRLIYKSLALDPTKNKMDEMKWPEEFASWAEFHQYCRTLALQRCLVDALWAVEIDDKWRLTIKHARIGKVKVMITKDLEMRLFQVRSQQDRDSFVKDILE